MRAELAAHYAARSHQRIAFYYLSGIVTLGLGLAAAAIILTIPIQG